MPTRPMVQPKNRNTEVEPDDSPTGDLTEDVTRQRPGPGSGGQSGDTQGLSDAEEATSESVLELVEEGAGLLEGGGIPVRVHHSESSSET